MNENLQTKLNRSVKEHHKRKKWLTIAASLCLVVAAVTSYVLINPADTQVAKTYCGYEKHTEHTEKCYKEVLVCELEEVEGHTHTDSCYEDVLSCGKEETDGHQHTDDCYAPEPVLICENTDEEHVHTDECYEKVLVCEQQECEPHHHDESCYTKSENLICGLEESEPHQHTDKCYKSELICKKPIHEHTLQCFSNPNADVENASVWEQTIERAKLTGKWSNDVISIAKTQLGYTESTNNYEVEEDGMTMRGYTRYGDWYGSAYGDWCAMFCSFCMGYADVDRDLIPFEASCPRWVNKLSDPAIDLFRPAGNEKSDEAENDADDAENEEKYIPKPGDLIFFDWDSFDPDHPEYREANHVGFVLELIYDEETDELIKIKTIEGNSGDCVCSNTYDFTDSDILGYGEMPENPNYVPPVEDSEDKREKLNLVSLKSKSPMLGTPAPVQQPIKPGSASGLNITASLVDGSHYEIADYFTVSVKDTLDNGTIALQYSDNGTDWTRIGDTKTTSKDGTEVTFTDNGTADPASKNRQWRVYASKTNKGTTTEHIYGPFNIVNLLDAAEPGFYRWLTAVYVEQLGGGLPTSVNGLYDILDYYYYYNELSTENPGFSDWLLNEYVQKYGGTSLPLNSDELDETLQAYLDRPTLTLTKNAEETSVTASAEWPESMVAPPADTLLYIWECYDYLTGKWSYLTPEAAVGGVPYATHDVMINTTNNPEISGKGIRCSMLDEDGNFLNTAQLDGSLNPVTGDISQDVANINDLLGLNAYPVETEGTTVRPDLSITLEPKSPEGTRTVASRYYDYFYYKAVERDSDVPFSDAESYARYLVLVYRNNGGDEAYNGTDEQKAALKAVLKNVWDKYLYDLYDPNWDTNDKDSKYSLDASGNYGDPTLQWPKDNASSFHKTAGTVAHPAKIDQLNYSYLENGVDYSNFMRNLDKTAITRNMPTASSERVYDVDITADCQAKVSSPVAMLLQVQTDWHVFDFEPGSHEDHAEVLGKNYSGGNADSTATENDSSAMNITSMADLYAIKHALLRFVDYMDETYPGNNLVLGVTEVQHGGSSSMFDGSVGDLYVSNNHDALREAILGWDIFGNCEHVHYDANAITTASEKLVSNLSGWRDFYQDSIDYNDIRKVGVVIGGVTENTNGSNGYMAPVTWSAFESAKFNSVYGIQVSDGVPRDANSYTSWLNNSKNSGTPFADGSGSGFTYKYDALTEDQVYNTLIQIAEREMTAKGLDLKAEDKFVDDVTLYDTIQPEFDLSNTENLVATVFNKDGSKAYETVISPDYSSATFNVYGTNGAVSGTTPLTVVATTETDEDGKTVEVYTIKDVPVPYHYTVEGVSYSDTALCDQVLKLTNNDDGSVAIVYNFGRVYNTKKMNLHLTLEAKEDYIGSNNVYTNVGTPDAEYTHYKADATSETYDIHTEKTPEVNVPIRFETEDGETKTVLVGTEVDLNELDAIGIVEDAVNLLDNYSQINGTMSFEWEMPDGTKVPVEFSIPVENGHPTGYRNMEDLIAAVEEAIQKNFTPEAEGTYKPRLNVTFVPDEMINDGNFHDDTKTLRQVPEKEEYGNVTVKALNGAQDLNIAKLWAPAPPEGTSAINYVVRRVDTNPVQYLYWNETANKWDFTNNMDQAQMSLSAENGWTETLKNVPTVIVEEDETITILDLDILETSNIPDYSASYREGTIYDNFAEFTVNLSSTADIDKYLRIFYTVDGVAKEYTTTKKVKFNNGLNHRENSVTVTLPDHYTSAPSIVITDAKVMKDDLSGLEANKNQKLNPVAETNPTVKLTPDPTTGRPSEMIINTGPFYQPGEDPEPITSDGITLNKKVSPYSIDGTGNIENEFVVTLGIEVDTAEYSKSLITATKMDGTTSVPLQLGGTKPQGNKEATLILKNSDGSTTYNGKVYWNGGGGVNDIKLYFGGVLLGQISDGKTIETQLFSQSFIDQFSADPARYISGKKQDGTSALEKFSIGTDPGGGCKKADLTIYAPDGTTVLFSNRIYFKPDNCSILLNGVKICELKDGNVDAKGQTVTLLSDAVFSDILDVVEDKMGPYVDYISDVTYPMGDIDPMQDIPADMYDGTTDILTWHPMPRTDSETGNLVAQLKYRIRLNTEKENFRSCATNMESAYGDDESFDTNTYAKLTTAAGQDKYFPLPYVRGILYNIEVKKTDESGNPLAGAKFEITCPDSPEAVTKAVNGHYYVTTDASGMAKFEDLVALEEGYFTGEFVITEVEAPEGYMITEDPKTVSISNYTHQPQWFVPDGSNMLYNPTDTIAFADKISPKLNLIKVSMENGTPLSGAEFTLYMMKENDELELMDMFTSDDLGVIVDALSLDKGTYILEETKAPDGYQLPGEQLKFNVKADATLDFVAGFFNQTDYDKRSNTYYYSVSNSSGYRIPETGGIGIPIFYAIGSMLLAVVAGVLISRKRINDKG